MPAPNFVPESVVVKLEKILVATDQEPWGDRAFAHALRIALGSRGEVTLFHAMTEEQSADWGSHPTVRRYLEAWGVLEPDASVAEFEALGIRVRLRARVAESAARAVAVQALFERPDLLVMAPHGRPGFERLFTPSVSEPASRWSRARTLFLPIGGQSLVDPRTGKVAMSRVLVPVDGHTPPRRCDRRRRRPRGRAGHRGVRRDRAPRRVVGGHARDRPRAVAEVVLAE